MPTLGQYLRLDRVSGTVTATLPNAQQIDLRNFAVVPVGTVVQTVSGVVKVTAALPGNRGAATVRGTIWQVTDTCTTTIVRVFRDKVSVVGFGNTVPKRATVTAGHKLVLTAG